MEIFTLNHQVMTPASEFRASFIRWTARCCLLFLTLLSAFYSFGTSSPPPGTLNTSANIIADPNSGSPITISKCFGSSVAQTQISFVASGNGEMTLTMPAGIQYIPGSITFSFNTAVNAGLTITEADISNLEIPVFDVDGVNAGDGIVIDFGVQADCSAPSGTVSITVDIGTNAGTTNANVIEPALSITSAQPAINTLPFEQVTYDVTISNGGVGSLDSMYIEVDNHTSATTVQMSIGGVPLPLISSIGGVDRFAIDASHFSGGSFDNGESIVVQRLFFFECGASTVNESYSVNFSCGGGTCQAPTPQYIGSTNLTNSIPTASISRLILSEANGCDSLIYSHTATNTSSPTALGDNNLYNVTINHQHAPTGGGGSWFTHGYFLQRMTVNGVDVTFSGAGFFGDAQGLFLASQFTSDPDGPGVGLEDLDGDGQFDDLAPGESFTIVSFWTMYEDGVCNANASGMRHYTGFAGNRICGGSSGNRVLNVWRVSPGVNSTLVAYPPEVFDLTTHSVEFFLSGRGGAHFAPVTNCPSDSFSLQIPAASWLTIQDIRINGSSIPFSLINDTVVGWFNLPGVNPHNLTFNFDFQVDFSQSPPNPLDLEYFLRYHCDSGCDPRGFLVDCSNIPPIGLGVPSPCSEGGARVISSSLKRTSLGFTDNTMSTRVTEASIPPTNLIRAMVNDSVQYNSVIKMIAGDSISGGEQTFLEIAYEQSGGANIFDWTEGTVIDGAGNTFTLPPPIFDDTVGSKHVITFFLGSLNLGDSIQVQLNGVVEALPGIDHSLTQILDFTNEAFSLTSFGTDPMPDGNTNERFSCFSSLIEFYVRDVRPSNFRDFTENRGNCFVGNLAPRTLYIRGQQSNAQIHGVIGAPVDYFPGEVRPALRIDSISVTLPTGMNFNPGGTAQLLLNGGGDSPATTFTGLGTPTISPDGQTITYVNNGSWPGQDEVLHGRYDIRIPITTDCRHTSAGYVSRFHVTQNFNSNNTSGYEPIVILEGNAFNSANPAIAFTNLTGSISGDAEEVFVDLQLQETNNRTANSAFLDFASGGNITVTRVERLSDNMIFNAIGYANGQWVQLGNILGNSTDTYRVFFTYDNCGISTLTTNFGWNCGAYPADPSQHPCAVQSIDVNVIPATAGIQGTFVSQPANPISLCQSLVYEFDVTSTLAGNVVDPNVDIDVPGGMTINQLRVEYPKGSGNFEDLTGSLSSLSGVVNFPLGNHSLISDSLPGVNNAGALADRQATIELTFLTDCNFLSGDELQLRLKGDQPCGDPVQGNNTLIKSSEATLAGSSPGYVSIIPTIDLGADSIITCSDKSITVTMQLFDDTNVPGAATIDGALDSVKVTIPNGFQYVVGSYGCVVTDATNASTTSICPGAPIVNTGSNEVTLSFAGSPFTINDGTFVSFDMTFDLNPLVEEECSVPGELRISSVRAISGIACATEPSGFCSNPVLVTTGSESGTIVAEKLIVSALNIDLVEKQIDGTAYDYSGSIDLSNVDLPAGQTIDIDVFAFENGVPTTLIGTHTINGPQTVPVNIPFSGSTTGLAPEDSVYFVVNQLSAAGTVQCLCSDVDFVTEAICPMISTSITQSHVGFTCDTTAITLTAGTTASNIEFDWGNQGDFEANADTVVTTTGQYIVAFRSTLTGCVYHDTLDLNISDFTLPVVNVSSTVGTIDCNSTSSVLTATSDIPGSTFDWLNGNGFTTDTDTTVTAGATYYVDVMNPNNGCVIRDSIIVGENTETPVITYVETPESCVGANDAILTASASGTNHPYSYSWNTGANTSSLNNTTSLSTYTVYVVGVNGCLDSLMITPTVSTTPPPPGPDAGTDGTLIICVGDTVTAVQLEDALTGEDSGGTWLETLAGAGTYHYVVDDGNFCTPNDTSQVIVTEQALPNAGTDGTLTICAGETVTQTQLETAITGEDAGGAWIEAFAGAGTYHYVVTATSPCTMNDTSEVVVTEQALPNAGTDGTLTICAGETVIQTQLETAITGEDAGGAWIEAFAGAGTYHYVVTATSPCTVNDTSEVVVTEQALPNAGADGTLTICAGETVTQTQLETAITGEDAGGAWIEAFAGAGTYHYVVTATSPCTVNDTSEVVVTEQALPNAGTDGTLTICTGETVTQTQLETAITGEDAGGAWVEAFSGAGTYHYVVTATSPCTVNDTSEVIVTEQALPNAGTDGTLTICTGETVTQTQLETAITGEDAGGVWIEAFAGAGTYHYVVTATSPCTVNDTSEVIVTEQALPNAGTDGTLTICTGETVTQTQLETAITGEDAGGTWVEAFAGAGTYHYVVTATSPCTINDTSEVVVTEQALPNAGTDGTLTICAGEIVIQTQLETVITGEDAGGAWIEAFAGAGTYHYVVTATSPCTINDTSEVVVIEQALPNAGADGTLTICAGETVTQTQLETAITGEDAGGSWIEAFAGAGTYHYVVTATSPCTVNDTSEVVVTEQALPNAGADGTLTICAGEVVTQTQLETAITGEDVGGTWIEAFAGAGTYHYVVTATSPCTVNDTSEVVVTEQALPNAGTDGTLTICIGEIVTQTQLETAITGEDVGGTWVEAFAGAGTYHYVVTATSPCTMNDTSEVVVAEQALPNAGTDETLVICAGEIVTQAQLEDAITGEDAGGAWIETFAGAGTYHYVVTATSPCTVNDTSEVVVTEQALPNAGTDGTLVICAGEIVTQTQLEDAITGEDAGGTWVETFAGAGTYHYVVTATSPCMVNDTSEVVVTEQAVPNAGIDGTLIICEGEIVTQTQLENAITGADTGGTWVETFAGAGTYHYVVTATSPCMENDTSEVVVTYNMDDTDGDGVIDCQEAIDGTDPDDPCDYLESSITTIVTSLEDCDGDGIPNADEVANGSDPNDPCDPKPCELVVPEGFTPNGDNINDLLVIDGIEHYPGNKLMIFNRWGNKVFEMTNYDNSWDGTPNTGLLIDGNKLPTGTYYYIINYFNGTDQNSTGFIYLKR